MNVKITDGQAFEWLHVLSTWIDFVELSKQDLERVLSEYEHSKRVKFDPDDESTWPELGDIGLSRDVMTNKGLMYFCKYGASDGHWQSTKSGDQYPIDHVKFWQDLPDLSDCYAAAKKV